MYTFKAELRKYNAKGEKTGWTFVHMPTAIIEKLRLKDRRGFRIKGKMNGVEFDRLSTYPSGEGEFIIAVNGQMRKKLRASEGQQVIIQFEMDYRKPEESGELLACLREDKLAFNAFNKMLLSRRNYFHRYINTAKTASTKTKRIVQVLEAVRRGWDFGQMVREARRA
jgi:hypothetical protein